MKRKVVAKGEVDKVKIGLRINRNVSALFKKLLKKVNETQSETQSSLFENLVIRACETAGVK